MLLVNANLAKEASAILNFRKPTMLSQRKREEKIFHSPIIEKSISENNPPFLYFILGGLAPKR